MLQRMYTAGYITLDEMNAAMNDELHVIEKSSTSGVYDMPHFVEYGIYDVVTHLLKSRELEDNKTNRAAIENELRTKGYSIYLTVDPNVQLKLQDTIANYDGYYKFGKTTASFAKNFRMAPPLKLSNPRPLQLWWINLPGKSRLWSAAEMCLPRENLSTVPIRAVCPWALPLNPSRSMARRLIWGWGWEHHPKYQSAHPGLGHRRRISDHQPWHTRVWPRNRSKRY